MPQSCTICRHAERAEIDSAILSGETFRKISNRYGTSIATLHRHKNHIPVVLAKAAAVWEEFKTETVWEKLKMINRETAAILQEAREGGPQNNGIALLAIARVEKQVELEARLLGQLSDAAKVAVGINIQHPSEKQFDLSGLTPDELSTVERILSKAAVQRQISIGTHTYGQQG